MRQEYAAGISLLVILLLVTPVCASEQTIITYIHTDIGDVHRYWYGQGEFTASAPGNTYTLHLNGNQLTSYATDAEITRFDPGSLEFSSPTPGSELHCLFTASRPEGHGLFTTEISVPYVSEEPGTRQVQIQIEDAARVLYLNGPVLFEDERFSSQGSLKIIDLTTTETEFTVVFVTGLAWSLISSIAGYILFVLVLLGMIAFRRNRIVATARQNLDRLSPDGQFPLRCRESEGGLQFTVSLPNNSGSGLPKVFTRDNEGAHITIPKAFIAGIFSVMFLVLVFWSLVTMGANTLVDMQPALPNGAITFFSVAVVLFSGALIGILLLSVSTVQDLIDTSAVLVGGVVLVLFTGLLGLLILPVSFIIMFTVALLGRAILAITNGKE